MQKVGCPYPIKKRRYGKTRKRFLSVAVARRTKNHTEVVNNNTTCHRWKDGAKQKSGIVQILRMWADHNKNRDCTIFVLTLQVTTGKQSNVKDGQKRKNCEGGK